MKQLSSLLLLLTMTLFSAHSFSADDIVDDYAYFAFEPDITTNYLTNGKDLGFIRLTMEVQVRNADDLAIVEHHAPLLRAAMVEILGEQPEERIKSMAGKMEIRDLCFEALNQLLKEETGKKLIVRLLFTKYLYQ